MLWYEKLVLVIGMLCSVSVIVLACLQLFQIWESAATIYMPLTAVLMLVQAFENRKKSRPLAIFSLCVAGFISVVCLLIFFVL